MKYMGNTSTKIKIQACFFLSQEKFALYRKQLLKYFDSFIF